MTGHSKMPIRYGKSIDTFFNDGRLYGWHSQHAENKGTIEEIRKDCFDNHIDSDNRCLKFTQYYQPDYRDRYHSEVVLQNATQHGDETFYGFAFKLQKDWEFDESYAKGPKVNNNRISIAQFITHFRDIDCGKQEKGAVPTTMVWLQNDNLYVRVRSGIVCNEEKGDVREYKIGKVVPGQWHTVVFGVLWHKEKEGWFKVWYDQKLRLDEENIKTFLDVDDRLFQFRVGIYPNWYTWDGSGHPFIKTGNQRLKTLYIDHIGFGPGYEDADPHSVVATQSSLTSKIQWYTQFIRRMKRDSATYNVVKENEQLKKLKLQLEQLLASTNSSIVEIPDKEDKDSKNNEEDEEETELDKAVDKAEQPPDMKIDEDAADQEMDKDEVETANPLQLTEQEIQLAEKQTATTATTATAAATTTAAAAVPEAGVNVSFSPSSSNGVDDKNDADMRKPMSNVALQNERIREEARNPPKPRGKVVHRSWGFFHYFKADHFFLFVALLLICYVFRTNFRDGDEHGLLNAVNGQFDINTVRRAVVSELAMRIHGDKKEDSKEYV